MIKRYNESDYNLQLRFLGRRQRKQFLFLFIILPGTEDIVTLYDDKSY